MFDRKRYLQQLIDRKNNGLIKVITGIRRCGKSYLLFNIFKNYLLDNGIDENHIISVQLDNVDYEELTDIKKLNKYIKDRITDKGIYYVLLDEIQLVDGFERLLNGLLYLNNVDCYVTGSNSKFLSSDIITEFRGRGDEIRVRPLSFSEYYNSMGGDKKEALDDYMRFGGLPVCVLANNDEQKEKYLIGLFETIYLVDIKERNNVNNSEELDELVNFLSSGIGTLTNPNKLSNAFKSIKGVSISSATINSYIGYLENAFIIEKAMRYDVKGKRYISTPMKYYFEDLGLRNARINFRQYEETHLMENLIYNELRYRGFNVDVGVVEKNEHTEKGFGRKVQLEIDFIATKGYKKYYIQSAYSIENSDKLSQEESSLDLVGDSFQKVIIVMNTGKKYQNEKGYLIIGLSDFLLDENSLSI